MTTHWEPLSEDTENTLRALRRIARALALSGRELARRHGLTAPQLVCLRLLRERGAMSAGSLAAALSLSPQTVTGLADRLEARGLVTRMHSHNDRRQVLIGLSERGLETVRATAPTLQDRFVARLNALAPAKRRALRQALENVVTLLEADALDAAPLLAPGHDLGSAPARPAQTRSQENAGAAAPAPAGRRGAESSGIFDKPPQARGTG